MRNHFSAALALILGVLLAGCSSGGNGGGGGTTPVFVPGKWTVTLFLASNGNPGPVIEVDMNLAQSGNTISSDTDNTVDNRVCGGAHTDSTTGSVNGSQFNLVISINSETAALTGTLSADGKSIATLNTKVVSSAAGPCFMGDGGGFSGNFVPPLNGTWTGTMQLAGTTTSPTVTATFTEDPSFNVSGSMAVVDDPCFSSIATIPGSPGTSIGSLSSFIMTDATNTIDFTGIILAATGLAPNFGGSFIVTAGCTQESGTISLNLGAAAAMIAAPTTRSTNPPHAIDPVLVERMKALQAARPDHQAARLDH